MRQFSLVLGVFTMLLLVGCGSSPPRVLTATTGPLPSPQTVTYCVDGGKPLTLDVYQPRTGTGPRSLLVFVHGGSWAFGSSRISEQSQLVQQVIAEALDRGITVASVNYRLAPTDPWPAQVIDVRCAVRYLRANAAHWQVDPQHFVAMGNSAGAQLMSLVALSSGQVPEWDTSQWAGQSTAMSAVVDLWGPIDLLAGGWSQTALEIGRVEFQVSFGMQDAVLRAASPITYVAPGAPPFLIVQGSADTLVPPAQSRELWSRLLAAGGKATLVEVANAGHELRPSGGAITPTVDVVAEETVSFLASVTA